METLKISSNNFWVKLYCFVYNINGAYKSNLPEDTCSLRRFLLFGIPLLVLTLPYLLIVNIINIFIKNNKIKSDIEDFMIFPIVSISITFISLVIFNSLFLLKGGILGFFAQLYLYDIATIGILIVVFIAAIVIAYPVIKIWEKISDSNFDKPNVIVELYRSAKEKYCKKIEYVD